MIVDHELGLTHLGRFGLPPVRLVVENTPELGVDQPSASRATQGEGAVGAAQPSRACGQALAPSKLHPLLQARLLLPLREMLVQAMLGAKLLKRQSVANKTETATAHFTAPLRFTVLVFCLFAHHRHFLNWRSGALAFRSSQAT